MGCEDSMILVEFWHALDCVNGEDSNNAKSQRFLGAFTRGSG